MDFKGVLKSLRLRHNMTQKGLADALGVSESAIGMYERGQREPDFEMQELIADYFNVDLDYLMGRSKTMRRVTYSSPGLSDEALRIARAFDLADPKSRDLVLLALKEYLPAEGASEDADTA